MTPLTFWNHVQDVAQSVFGTTPGQTRNRVRNVELPLARDLAMADQGCVDLMIARPAILHIMMTIAKIVLGAAT